MRPLVLWLCVLALWLVACGSDESERARCERLCEKTVLCKQGFERNACLRWCRTLEDEDNKQVLHPQMVACLSLEDCPEFLQCLDDVREEYLGSSAQRLTEPAAGRREP